MSNEEKNEFQKLQREIYENAVGHGFWEPVKNPAENIALMHSELSEALEEYRNDKYVIQQVYYPANSDGSHGTKPEGFFVELADVIIRILDMAEHYKIDMWELMLRKHEYNKTREYRHGGKKL